MSSLIRAPGAKALEALTTISEDETQVRDAEAKQKIQLLKIGRQQWATRPWMSDHCAAGAADDVFEIHELKNRNSDCPDFVPQSPQPLRDCFSCQSRETHADPYAALNGVTTPEAFRSMKEGIDAAIGLEVTAIYYAKGDYQSLPIAHDWCGHYSHTEGRAYVALPYPNRHNDCLAHRSKREQRAVKSSAKAPTTMSTTDAIIVLSELVAAVRLTFQGKKAAFQQVVTQHLQKLKGSPLHKDYENLVMFLFRANTGVPQFAKAAQAIANVLSPRVVRLGGNDQGLMKAIGDGPFARHSRYLVLGNVEGLSASELEEMCAQTMREGYWLDRLGISARREVLNEERARLQHGMYPAEIVPSLEQLTGYLERLQSKTEAAAKTDPDADTTQASAWVAPLSNPVFVQRCEEASAMVGVPNPFPQMDLDDQQQEALDGLISGSYRLDMAVAFLENQHAALLDVINEFWRVGDPGNVPFELSPYDKLTRYLSVLDMAHRFVTTMLNRFGRRLHGSNHVDYPYAPPSINNLGAQKAFTKAERTLGLALFPPVASLDMLAFAGLQQSAKQSKPRPSSKPSTRSRASTRKEQIEEEEEPEEGSCAELEQLEGEQEEEEPVEEPAANLVAEFQRQYDAIHANPGKSPAAEQVFLALIAFAAKQGSTDLTEAEFADLAGSPNPFLGRLTDDLVDRLIELGLLRAPKPKRRR